MQEELKERRINLAEVSRRLEIIEQEQAAMADKIERGVESGVEKAVEKALDKFLVQLQQRAIEHTGRWFISTLLSILKRWLITGCILIFIGKYLGWQTATQIFDTVFARK